MSPRSLRIREHLITTVITVVATVFITGAVRVYETRAEHNADMQRVEDRLERILDVVCATKPEARACASTSTGDVTHAAAVIP